MTNLRQVLRECVNNPILKIHIKFSGTLSIFLHSTSTSDVEHAMKYIFHVHFLQLFTYVNIVFHDCSTLKNLICVLMSFLIIRKFEYNSGSYSHHKLINNLSYFV